MDSKLPGEPVRDRAGNSDSQVDDVVDLGKYLIVPFRRWRVILILTLVAAAIGAAIVARTPRSYEAVAGVAMVKLRSDVEFDPRFKTMTGDTTSSGIVQASDARRSALLGLVQSGAIASVVIARLGDRLTSDERNPAVLMDRVKAENLQKGDLILIRVRDQDAAKAADIANAWAQEYERSINSIYGGSPLDYSLSVQSELTRTRQAFDQAQSDLERFLATNRTEALTRQISDTQQIANALADAGVGSQVEVVAQESLARVRALQALYSAQVRVRSLLEDARAMRDQVRAGGEAAAASNGLALQLLKAQAFAMSAELPGQLQVQAGATSATTSALAQTADLEALIGALEKRDVAATAAIAAQSQALLAAPSAPGLAASATLTAPVANQTVVALQSRVRTLRAELEKAQATWDALTQARDLARETYTTLASKQSELAVAAAASGSEVRYVLPAVPPANGSSTSATTVLTAALVGLLLGLAAAFVAEYLLGGGPPRSLAGGPSAPWNRLWRWTLS